MRFMNKPIFDYDICISGGGMVGLTSALLLAKAGFSVLVLEKHQTRLPVKEQAWDLRCSAITLASQTILESIDAWPKDNDRIQAYDAIQLWEQGCAAIDFKAQALALPALGYVIENNLVLQALLANVSNEPLMTYRAPAFLLNFTAGTMGWELTVNDNELIKNLSCRLLIGADGADSPLRKSMHLEQSGWAYDCAAMISHVQTNLPHQNMAYQCFTPDGPLAFLPLADKHRCSIVWSVEQNRAQELQSLNDDDFSLELGRNFEFRLGAIEQVASRHSFPLALRYAKKRVLEGIALVGESAQVLHPMAGQGLNLGIIDAWKLTQILIQAKNNHWDFGSYKVLRQYERWAKGRLLSLGLLTEGLHRLYQTSSPSLIQARRLGLRLFNQQSFLKHFCMEYAAGLNELSLKSADFEPS